MPIKNTKPSASEIETFGENLVINSHATAGLILGLHPANERCRYKVTPSLTGWAQT